jgi:hypothetical protein
VYYEGSGVGESGHQRDKLFPRLQANTDSLPIFIVRLVAMREIGENLKKVKVAKSSSDSCPILQSIFKLVSVVIKSVQSSGRYFPMSMESTQQVPTRAPAIFS